MDRDRFQTRSRTEPCSVPHVLDKSPHCDELRVDPSLTRGKIGLGVAVVALLGCCLIGLVVSSRRTINFQQQSPQQLHIKGLADHLSILTQTNLIVFPGGVWYVMHYMEGTWK
jgi:hypothetical protein